jgi:hypothetical protein
MTTANTLNQIRTLINNNQTDQALTLAQNRDSRAVHDPALHLAWADLLEELGLVDEVIQELNLAIRDEPENKGTYYRLAEIYLDQGRLDRAVHLYASLVQKFPLEAGTYRQWAEALKASGDYPKALEIFQQGYQATQDDSFPALIRDLQVLTQEKSVPETMQSGEQIIPSQPHLVTFTTRLAGREGVYARQWVSPTGESGYTPVQEPLTLKVAENHILGNYTIGVYPVRLDNTVNFIAFDFDLAKFAVRKSITSQSAWEAMMAKVHQVACKLVDLGAAQDLPIYIEDSGFKGRHAWIFLDTPLPAGVAKKCGDLLVNRLHPLPVEVTVEVFPKQGSVKPGGLGNLIKLPLGFHKRTGKRAVFIQPDGEPYPNQLSFLEGAAKASRRSVYGLIQRFQAQKQDSPPWEEAPVGPAATPEPAARLPFAPPVFNLDQDPQFQFMLSKCPVLQAIGDKVHQTSMLSKDETMVLIHTLGHLDHGPEAVNELFQRCINADPALFLKSRLRGNPMSCPKIRSRIPQITSTLACNCAFNLGSNLYPTPLIHLQEMGAVASSQALGLTVDSLQFQNLLQEYLKLRKQLHETRILLERYEKRLSEFFTEIGVESVQTAMGRLCCRKKEDGGMTFTLEI